MPKALTQQVKIEEDIKEQLLSPASINSASDVEELRKENSFLEDTRRAIFNILEDVSSSEEKLKKKSEELEKFHQAADTSFDHIVIVDPNGKILYANHAAELLTGYSREEMVGSTPALWGRQMPREFYETMWQTIKTEKNKYAGELTNKRKDGTKYLSSLRISPVFNEDGEIHFFVGIERDITEERQSQLKIVRHAAELEQANTFIAEEKERAESILQYLKSIGEGVFATDREDQIIFMNETAELMTGMVIEKKKSNRSQDLFLFIKKGDDGDEEVHITEIALREKRTITFPRSTFLKRADKEIPIAGTCSLIRDKRNTIIGTITILQDVTKRHELDQMKDSFLSVAAHQLRTPLGGMRWSMELLLNGDLGKLPKGAKEAIKQIYENSQRMILLVNDLLSVSRIDQNKGREEKTPIQVERVVSDVVRAMRSEADRRGVTIILQKEEALSLPIMAPEKHFYEAFENILSNSIKYNKQGGTVTIRYEKNKEHMVIIIADTGIGIPKDSQSKIFAKFFRASNAVRKETEGSGLGLSVVKSYLEEAGATIRFESQEDVGTTFFVEFPVSI